MANCPNIFERAYSNEPTAALKIPVYLGEPERMKPTAH